MDCEKFEATLIDELYGELDELTSAAAKRHVAGCARCASLLGGLRATRRIAVLPLVEPSADLEDRILSAAKDAQKVVPIHRFSRAVSWAGSWAMRPQTAMAAVFLLMVGMSGLVIVRGHAKAPASAAMTITEQGSPAASGLVGDGLGEQAKLDTKAAAAAHGTDLPQAIASAAPVPAATATTASADEGYAAYGGGGGGGGGGDNSRGAVARREAPSKEEGKSALALDDSMGRGTSNASAPAGAPQYASPPPPPMAQAAPPARPAPVAANDPYAQQQQYGGPRDKSKDATPTAFDSAMALYRNGSFVESTRAFDALANNGDTTAALWAARSVRDGNGGCGLAIDRFDSLAQRALSTPPGNDAMLEGGRCLRAVGMIEAARAHFSRLLTLPDYAARAQAEIDSMTQVASRAAAESQKHAAPKKAQQQPPAASPPAATIPSKATDVGF